MLIIAFSPLDCDLLSWITIYNYRLLNSYKNSKDDNYIVIQLIIFRPFSVVLDYGRGFG